MQRTVLTIHDYFSACPNGAFLNYRTGKVCTLKPLGLKCTFTNCDKRHFLHKTWRVARNAVQRGLGIPKQLHHLITLSDLSEQILRPYLNPCVNIYRISNPLDITKIDRVKAELNTQILFVGRLAPEKAPHHLAIATNNLGLPVVFVGSGELEQEIHRLNPSAIITGWVSRSDVMSWLKQARALVLPSVWYEGFPLVLREAIAMGIPIVVSDVCSGKEIVQSGINGWVYRGGEVDSLTKVLTSLQSPALVEAVSKTAYKQYWDAPFSVANHSIELLSVYQNMIAE